MLKNEDWLIVGLILSPHGINGKVNVKSLTDFPERFTNPGPRWIQKNNNMPINLELTSGFQKPGKETFIVTFKDINNRNKAENLNGHKILVKYNDIPKMTSEEFHLSELINLKVKRKEDNELKIIGEVIDLISEKNNLLIIELFKTRKRVLVPFVEEIIPFIDKKNNFLIINPPKGLLEL